MRSLIFLILVSCNCQSALFFNGSTAKLYFDGAAADPPAITGTTLTMGAWIKPSGTNYIPIIFKNQNSLVNIEYCLAVNDAGTNCMTFSYRSGGVPNANQNTWSSTINAFPSTSNVWVHVAVTYQWGASLNPIFYVNGSPITGGRWTTGAGDGVIPGPVSYLYVGTDLGTVFYSGQISEISYFYRQVLNSSQVFNLAKSKIKYIQKQITPPNLGLYYPLDSLSTFKTASGTNSVLNMGFDGKKIVSNFVRTHLTPIGSPVSVAETVCSYPPNE